MEKERTFIGLKDIVFVTLLTAISIVICTVVVIPLSFNLVLVLWAVPFVDMLLVGPIYTLACARAPRIGTHFLFAFLFAIYYYFTNGMILISLMIVVIGLIGELVLLKGGYRTYPRITIAFALYGLGVMLAPVMMIVLYGSSLTDTMLASGLSAEYIDAMFAVYSPLNIAIGALSSIVGSILGCFIGTRFLKKHFKPAGIVETQHAAS